MSAFASSSSAAAAPNSSDPQPGDGAYLVMQSQQRAQRQRTNGGAGGAAAAQGNESYRVHHPTGQGVGGGVADGGLGVGQSARRSAKRNGGGGPGKNHPGRQGNVDGDAAAAAGAGLPNGGGRRRHHNDNGSFAALDASTPAFVPGGNQHASLLGSSRDFSLEPPRPSRNKGKGKGKASRAAAHGGGGGASTDDSQQQQPQSAAPPRQSRRAAAFQGKLTTSASRGGDDQDSHYHPHGLADDAMDRAATGHIGRGKRSRGAVLGAYGDAEIEGEMDKEKDDLASKLMRGLSRRPFLECPIVSEGEPRLPPLADALLPVLLATHSRSSHLVVFAGRPFTVHLVIVLLLHPFPLVLHQGLV